MDEARWKQSAGWHNRLVRKHQMSPSVSPGGESQGFYCWLVEETVCVHMCECCVCHVLEGTFTNADYMTDGTAVPAIMNAIVK